MIKKFFISEILLVFFMVLCFYGYFSPTTRMYPKGSLPQADDWNANSRMSLVKAFVEEGSLTIDHYTQSLPTGDMARFKGHYYSDKAIGSSLLGIMFYTPIYVLSKSLGYQIEVFIFKELITFLAISLICAFLAPLVYSFAKEISGNALYALLVTLVICLGTPFFYYSTEYYGHSLAGTFLFIAFFLWFHIKKEGRAHPIKVFISAYFLAFAFITEYTTAAISLIIGIYILHVLWTQKRIFRPEVYVSLALGCLLPLSAVLLYNQVAFHNPLSTGYMHESLALFAKPQSTGLMGIGWPNLNVMFYMTFHTTMGIFWQSPVLLLAFIGWVAMWRNSKYRAEAACSFGIILGFLILLSGYFAWWGGMVFTPRGIIPALPFFVIPLSFVPRKVYIVVIFMILALISIVQMLLVRVTAPNDLLKLIDGISTDHYYAMFQNSTIYTVYLEHFLARKLIANRGYQFLGLRQLQSFLPLLIVEAVLAVLFIKSTWASFSESLVRV